ncbi:N-acetylglucosamine-6-phosphate deacetylase-like isoform X2 [Branchiostoma floridae x Branchiostoma belcheri]
MSRQKSSASLKRKCPDDRGRAVKGRGPWSATVYGYLEMPSNRSTSTIYQFYNCRILKDGKLQREDLWIRDGKILNPEKLFFDEKGYADVRIDCKNLLISPGYIDVQINGGFGVDFSSDVENIEEGLSKVAKGLLAYGCTSFCPTIVTSPPEIYKQILPRIKLRDGSSEGAGVLGIHIEGPFISKDKKGAHPERYLKKFHQGWDDVLDTYSTMEGVKLFTVAPELENSSDVIKQMVKRNIRVSVGHSSANLSQAEAAVKAGATCITHLFNAMGPFHHRDPGIVGLLTSHKIPTGVTLFYGMIADGIHTDPAALRIAYRAHPRGIVLVTDAITAMGLPIGSYKVGQQEFEVTPEGRAFVLGTKTLIGSIVTMDKCVKHFLEATSCSVEEALDAGTRHPAEMLGIAAQKGTLDYNSDADFILLDDELNVQATYIAGELVWDKVKGHHGKRVIQRKTLS